MHDNSTVTLPRYCLKERSFRGKFRIFTFKKYAYPNHYKIFTWKTFSRTSINMLVMFFVITMFQCCHRDREIRDRRPRLGSKHETETLSKCPRPEQSRPRISGFASKFLTNLWKRSSQHFPNFYFVKFHSSLPIFFQRGLGQRFPTGGSRSISKCYYALVFNWNDPWKQTDFLYIYYMFISNNNQAQVFH